MLWQCLFSFCYSGVSVLIPAAANRIFGLKNFTAIYAMIIGLVVIKCIFLIFNIKRIQKIKKIRQSVHSQLDMLELFITILDGYGLF
jgi:hypothetical protein